MQHFTLIKIKLSRQFYQQSTKAAPDSKNSLNRVSFLLKHERKIYYIEQLAFFYVLVKSFFGAFLS